MEDKTGCDRPEITACSDGRVFLGDGKSAICLTKAGVLFVQSRLAALAPFLGIPASQPPQWPTRNDNGIT